MMYFRWAHENLTTFTRRSFPYKRLACEIGTGVGLLWLEVKLVWEGSTWVHSNFGLILQMVLVGRSLSKVGLLSNTSLGQVQGIMMGRMGGGGGGGILGPIPKLWIPGCPL